MVVLTEQIEIPSSYEKLEAWTANFKERHWTWDTGKRWIVQIFLLADAPTSRRRLSSDIAQGIRAADSVDRSVARIHTYQVLDTIKIETSNQTAQEITDEICVL